MESKDETFKVILQGYQAGKGEYYVEADFAKAFKISQHKARELFSAAPQVIRDNLPLEQAEHYKAVIEKAGGKCELESMRYDTSGLSLE